MSGWETILAKVRTMHEAAPALQGFCPFPKDLRAAPCDPCDHPASLPFTEEDFGISPHGALISALQAAASLAHWRRTYEGTGIGQDFMTRFGCFALIGSNAPYISDRMQAFFVYMPAAFFYTWHHHVAEEVYYVLGGKGYFKRDGRVPKRLGPDGSVFHASLQPHALATHDRPVLAYVLWRDNFDSPPELTEGMWREAIQEWESQP